MSTAGSNAWASCAAARAKNIKGSSASNSPTPPDVPTEVVTRLYQHGKLIKTAPAKSKPSKLVCGGLVFTPMMKNKTLTMWMMMMTALNQTSLPSQNLHSVATMLWANHKNWIHQKCPQAGEEVGLQITKGSRGNIQTAVGRS